MKRPALVHATQAELDALLTLAKTTFPTAQYQLLEGVLGTFVYVMQALQNAPPSLKRFRQLLFGARTESKCNVLKDHGASAAGDPRAAGDATAAGGAIRAHWTNEIHDEWMRNVERDYGVARGVLKRVRKLIAQGLTKFSGLISAKVE